MTDFLEIIRSYYLSHLDKMSEADKKAFKRVIGFMFQQSF